MYLKNILKIMNIKFIISLYAKKIKCDRENSKQYSNKDVSDTLCRIIDVGNRYV